MRILFNFKTSSFVEFIQSSHVSVVNESFVELHLGHDSPSSEISLHSEHLISVLFLGCSFLRSFASISKISSAFCQSFSDIGKFGNMYRALEQ